MKRFSAIILTVAMLLSTLILTVNATETNTSAPFTAGYSETLIDKLSDEEMEGIPDILTAASPAAGASYKITSGEGLARFADWGAKNWCTKNQNLTVYLANDIDVAAYPNLQCGTGYSEWGGIFDGQGYSIKNWSLEISATGDNKNGAFFAYVTGTVKNVVIDRSCKVAYKTTGWTRGTSSLVGWMGKGASVLNCKSSATVDSDLCRVNSASDVRGSSKVGGLIGRLESVSGVTIENLTFEGRITSASGVGGIIGYIGSGAEGVEIKNCVNSGSVTSENTAAKNSGEAYWRCGAGGIVGLQDCGTVSAFENCHNYGTVTNSRNSADAYAGAIIGIICQDNTTVNISNCKNYGQLISVGKGGGYCGNRYNNSIVNENNCTDYRTLPQIEGYQTQIVEEGAAKQGIRIIASIDSLNYQNVGFIITIKDASGNPVEDKNGNKVENVNYTCKYVYTSLVGMNGDTVITYSRDTLRPDGYLFAIIIPDIPASLGTVTVEAATFCVTATTDGSVGAMVAGDSFTFTHTIGTNR